MVSIIKGIEMVLSQLDKKLFEMGPSARRREILDDEVNHVKFGERNTHSNEAGAGCLEFTQILN